MRRLVARARSLWHGVRRPERLEAEMDEEMRFHIEMEAERLAREQGLDPGEARRRAAIAFGGVEKRKEEGRSARGAAWLSGMSLDFKLGVRMLRKHPGLTAVGVLGMAVAMAVGAGVFGFLRTMTDPALPLSEGDRIVSIRNLDARLNDEARSTHLHDLEVWRTELGAVSELGAYRIIDRNLIGPDGRGEPLRVAEMTASGFRIARVPPLRGRWLVDDDERPGAAPVAVIGHSLWRSRFGTDPEVVGSTVRLGAERYTIVGVMPEGFAFPVRNRIWTPLRLDASRFAPGRAPEIEVFGWLAPSATLEQAAAQLAALGHRAAVASPATHEHVRPRILLYTRAFLDAPELLWVFYLVQVVVSLLLVVIAANVAILVYARTVTRAGEIAMRMALGASRARVVGQLFLEALLLALVAAALGLGAAAYALAQVAEYIDRIGGEEVPFWWKVGLTPGMAVYALGLALLAAVIVGVLPALRVTSARSQGRLRELGGATGPRMGKTWTALVVVQVAVAVAILPATVALGWRDLFPDGIHALRPVAEGLLSAPLGMERGTPPTAEAERSEREAAERYADRVAAVVARLEAEPAVAAVSFTADGVASASIEVEARRAEEGASERGVRFLQVDPEIFDLFEAGLLAGRDFGGGTPVGPAVEVMVNRSFAETVLHGDALGRRFRYTETEAGIRPGGVEEGGWYEIVGVVEDSPVELPYAWRGVPTLYHPTSPERLGRLALAVQVRGSAAESFAPRMREIVSAVDPTLQLGEVLSVARRHRQQERTRRMATLAIVVGVLSVVLLSAAGIHALMSFTVARRRKEIGIRTALGARPGRILASVFARALKQLGLGVAVGGVAGGAMIFGDSANAERAVPLLLVVAAVMLAVGLLAALGPARRGLAVQPMEALREE